MGKPYDPEKGVFHNEERRGGGRRFSILAVYD